MSPLVKLVVFIFVLALVLPSFVRAEQGGVLVVRISSEIARPTVELVDRSLKEAELGGARLIVYELNTPGGELGAVTDIMNKFNNAPLPVLVWVAPIGAVAWSGGTYILMASHIAAMASGTTIGSAQPVLSTGEVLNESKYMNALSALIRDNARLHDRNQTIAQEFVTRNLNLGPEEAVRLHVIEFVADNLPSLLLQLEPYSLILEKTEFGTSAWKLVLKDTIGALTYTKRFDFSSISQAKQYTYEPGINIRLLQLISNPLIASVLFIVGLYTIVIGFKTPGFGVEITGALMFFLALAGFGIIGINIAAALLFVLGVILTLIEIKTHHGIFALAGVATILLGSFLAFPVPGWELLSARAVESAKIVFLSTAFAMSAVFGFVAYKVAQARRLKVKVGPEQLIGKTGIALSELAPRGEIRVEGQIWRAMALAGNVKQGELVEVVDREGLMLRVKAKQAKNGV